MAATATATVILTLAWLMDPTDPTNPIVAGTSGSVGGGTRTNTITRDGEYRTYVNRVRMIVRPTTTRTYAIAFRNLDKTTADKLERWAGRTLLLRDIYGRRIWGSFFTTSRLEFNRTTGACDVAFTFTEISYDETV